MATPTLTMIPSGYKAEKVYSVLPTNGDGDFTFDRTTTATRVNKNGLIEQVSTDVPRLDYSDSSCPSLLLEPTSTNLVIGSAEGNYGGGQSSATNTISPDGTNNAFIPTPDYVYKRYEEIIPAGTYSNGQKLTYSWYRKRISTPTGVSVNGDLNIKSLVNLTELETSNATQIESNINGFDRFQAVVEIIDGSLESIFRAYFGDVVGVGNSSVAYFGHQFEALRYATSYIPTTSGTESRSAETFSNDFSSQPTVANTNTVVLKFIPMGFSTDFYELLRFSDADGTNEIALEGFQTNNYDVYGSGLVPGGMNAGSLSLDAGSINTISFSYSGTSLRFSHNGSTIAINTPTGNLPTITKVLNNAGGLSPIKILDLRVYNDFKTQEELNTLTI